MMLQTSTISESLQPLPPAEHMFLVFDGACSKHGLRSWYELGLDVCPLMVLKDGVYDGVSALGPMIADLRASTVLKALWENNHPIMRRAAVYHTSYDEMGLLDFLRARVQVIMPGELLAWLRLGDARVVSRLAEADGHFPPQFWSGVGSIFFQSETASITRYCPFSFSILPTIPTVNFFFTPYVLCNSSFVASSIGSGDSAPIYKTSIFGRTSEGINFSNCSFT